MSPATTRHDFESREGLHRLDLAPNKTWSVDGTTAVTHYRTDGAQWQSQPYDIAQKTLLPDQPPESRGHPCAPTNCTAWHFRRADANTQQYARDSL